MMKRFKSLFPEKFKGQLLEKMKPVSYADWDSYIGIKKVVVALAGLYQNLGDMALTWAHIQFLKGNFPQFAILVVPSSWTYERMKALKHIVGKEDIITVIGGGNMDDMYTSLEDCRRHIVESFPYNRIVLFPQTISFSDTPYGKKRLKASKRTYCSHKNIFLFTREQKSFDFAQTNFPGVKCALIPDMVLYLNETDSQYPRKGVMCCLREDKEQMLSQREREGIRDALQGAFDPVEFTDTVNVTLEECKLENLETTLKRFWMKVKTKEVVITDRLHCMIFCAITKTPCVVMDNANGKISRIHEKWLRNVDFISLIDKPDAAQVVEQAKILRTMDFSKTKPIDLRTSYQPLIDAITSESL